MLIRKFVGGLLFVGLLFSGVSQAQKTEPDSFWSASGSEKAESKKAEPIKDSQGNDDNLWKISGVQKSEKESYVEWFTRLQKEYPVEIYGSLFAQQLASILILPDALSMANWMGFKGNFAHMTEANRRKIRVMGTLLQAGWLAAYPIMAYATIHVPAALSR